MSQDSSTSNITQSGRFTPAPAPKGTAIALWNKPSPDYAQKLAATQAHLRQITAQYQPITLACSLGAEDMVLLHMLHSFNLPCEAFVLQTGKLNSETLELLALVQKQYGQERSIRVYEPDAQLAAAFVRDNGEDAMYKSLELRKACCHIRKMLPLAAALRGKRAWITGLRREQSAARADVPLHSSDGAHDDGHGHPIPREKFNPLTDWTWGDVWHYIHTQAVPYNSLHDQFYPSIGCQPCTRSVTLGEDFRAGRWWWESSDLKECGLHVKPHS
jgi:phosphoadenosine phosphosulfate reductase